AGRGGFGRDDDRPKGRPRRVHFEDDGRAPEIYEPKGADRKRPDRDDQPARSFGKPAARGDRPQGGKPFGDRPKRDFGDRPPRRDGDGPARGSFGDRPKRDFGDRPARGGFGDMPARGGFGDRPARGPRPDRGF